MIVAAPATVAVALVGTARQCQSPAGPEVDVILNHVKSCHRCREPEARQSSPPLSSRRVGTVDGADGEARAACRGPPLCAGTSDLSGRVPRCRRPGPPRRRGGEPETPSPLFRSGPQAVRRGTRGAPARPRTQAAAGGSQYAEAVSLALPAPIQEAATYEERPAFRCAAGMQTGDP